MRVDGVAGDRLPLPKCSYVNTDFPGDDLFPYDDDDGVVDEDDYEKRGINAGSARYCVGPVQSSVVCKSVPSISFSGGPIGSQQCDKGGPNTDIIGF